MTVLFARGIHCRINYVAWRLHSFRALRPCLIDRGVHKRLLIREPQFASRIGALFRRPILQCFLIPVDQDIERGHKVRQRISAALFVCFVVHVSFSIEVHEAGPVPISGMWFFRVGDCLPLQPAICHSRRRCPAS
ncbi:hypothetical protein WS71_24485 [Burkholderia mayonis]|uniref:Uncharacterized protein n=1 Tax=Burkholderia mayonis TaxID=1385591 RepID=A0A1B4G359_9BURK|nr:hypothetical protein WS71_24485 [Burkholderia mayonis]KVE53651.1 hypothetical protein WS71_06295 [Burkholderia mayonis]